LGFILPALALYLISTFRPELAAIQRFEAGEIRHLNMQIMTVAMLPNVAVFFLAMQRENESLGRGLIISTLLLLVAVFIYRFLL